MVQLLESLDDLTHEVSRLLLGKFTSNLSQLIQVAAIAVLREQVKVILSFLDVKEADDVGALDLTQDAYF